MPTEYILLIILAILPVFYRYSFWLIQAQNNQYNDKKYWDLLNSSAWKQAIYNFWWYIETFILILAIRVALTPIYEIIFYKVYFYLLIIMNIFVLWKILRNKITLPKYDHTLCIWAIIWILWIIAEIFYISHYYPNFIYSYISILLLLSPLVVYLWLLFLSLIYKIIWHQK